MICPPTLKEDLMETVNQCLLAGTRLATCQAKAACKPFPQLAVASLSLNEATKCPVECGPLSKQMPSSSGLLYLPASGNHDRSWIGPVDC